MTSNPSPGGSQEPPNFSQDPTPADTWKVCAALEYDMRFEGQPRIEATIGPADAWVPTREQYRSVAQRNCEQSKRITDLTNQRNAAWEMIRVVEGERDAALGRVWQLEDRMAEWHGAAVAFVAWSVLMGLAKIAGWM